MYRFFIVPVSVARVEKASQIAKMRVRDTSHKISLDRDDNKRVRPLTRVTCNPTSPVQHIPQSGEDLGMFTFKYLMSICFKPEAYIWLYV
jgi:predicted glycosyltransferase